MSADVGTQKAPDVSQAGRRAVAATPTLREMFRRLITPDAQSRAAVSVEYFGWLDMALGTLILIAPYRMAALFTLPDLTTQGANYLRLVGLLVGGLGMLYVAAGRLNAQGFVFASLLDRPLVPGLMTFLWYIDILPGPLALAFSITDFGGFLWTLWAWRKDARLGPYTGGPRFGSKIVAEFFAFISGVIRNARTFHPDGRVFRGTVQSVHLRDPILSRAAEQLNGTVLMRIGMGIMKKSWPLWLADRVPDAPSIAMRISSNDINLQRRPGEDLDLLCTAGGDRLWRLLVNLATGGRKHGLHQFDYFENTYYADVPYRIDDGALNVWVRLVPNRVQRESSSAVPRNSTEREEGLDAATKNHSAIGIEVQRVGDGSGPFVRIAEITFEKEITLDVDQEALHFDPVAGRGFEPYGFLTEVRNVVYPASVRSRAATAAERDSQKGRIVHRFVRFLRQRPSYAPREEAPKVVAPGKAGTPAEDTEPRIGWRRWVKLLALSVLAIVVLFGAYMVVRVTRDIPVDYSDDRLHFRYGSTGGERTNGVPYWLWVALPELFYEYLPDKAPGHGYSSLGMIYEPGKDPRYALPVGVSRRNFRGIDVVYLNCASCHTGTVRKAPATEPLIVEGMPAHTFNLGAWGNFLTSIVKDQKFTPQRLLEQIEKMQDNPNRLVDKPDLINRLIFRFYAVYVMREQLLTLGQRLDFIDTDSWGPGRVDTFNAPKALLNFPMKKCKVPPDPDEKKCSDPKELIGNVDFPSVWNQKPREGMQLHWDGNNTSVDERNLSAAFGTGAYPPTLDTKRVQRTARWLLTAKPPDYASLFPVDGALAAKGAPIYQQYCLSCHGTREPPFHGERVGKVVPIEKIGTDRWRLDSYTWPLAVNQSTLYAGYEQAWGFAPDYPHRFTHFRKQPGYANSPLDGIWLRAPYLHNGSVPNLWELLKPAENRIGFFYRGNDVYDPRNVGFVYDVKQQDGHQFFAFDTKAPGNGKGGHTGRAYGTELSDAKKWELIEYLKTF